MNPNPATVIYQTALEQLRSDTCSGAEKLKAGATLILEQQYDDYPEVIRALESLKSQYGEHPLWNFCLGYAQSTNQLPEPAIAHLHKALGHINNNLFLYRALAWAHLQMNAFEEAFLASSAGLYHFPNDGHLKGLLELSKLRAQGSKTTKFNYEGTDYEFALFSNNTQEIEAAVTHILGRLTEPDELRMIRTHIGKVDSIAEVGCLVGNHSAFFLKNLKPKRYTIIDASSISLKHTKSNVELNQDPTAPAQIHFIHSAIGKQEGEISFFNETVPINPLDKLLQEPFEFLKIDVDGMEIDALNGALDYLHTNRPKVMIEVLHTLKTPFEDFLQKAEYRIIAQHNHSQYGNYLIGPYE